MLHRHKQLHAMIFESIDIRGSSNLINYINKLNTYICFLKFAKHARGTVTVMLHGSRVDLDGKIVPYRADR